MKEQVRSTDALEDVLDALAKSGDITRAAMPKRTWTWHTEGLGLAAGTAVWVLDQVRDDR